MIEKQFVSQKMKELSVCEYVTKSLGRVGHSYTKIVRTPLGDKVVIYASRPGLVIGRQGENIKLLTKTLKNKFKLENPQIEIVEVQNPNLDAQIVAETVASALERYGPDRFKGIAHKVITDTLKAGALGIELLISGKVPSARAKTWRFYSGYIKKCGDVSVNGMRNATSVAQIKSGAIGIRVKLMPPDIRLPDKVIIYDEATQQIIEKKEEATQEAAAKEEAKKEKPKKKAAPKKAAKKEETKTEEAKE